MLGGARISQKGPRICKAGRPREDLYCRRRGAFWGEAFEMGLVEQAGGWVALGPGPSRMFESQRPRDLQISAHLPFSLLVPSGFS